MSMARPRPLHAREIGDCYQVAADLLIDSFGAYPEARLVHGWPTLRRRPFREYGHAWVELGPVVFDFANKTQHVLLIGSYYELGQIDPARCIRYTAEQARGMLLSFESYGPWECECAA